MVAGPPNAGKSLFAFILAGGFKVPTLYVSADTDEWTMLTRAASHVTGEFIENVERNIASGMDGFYQGEIADALPYMEFAFDPAPTLDDLEDEVLAFEEKHGEAPHVVVIDNLMNVQAETDNEWAGMRFISKALHHLARESDAHVLVLHHTAEGKEYDPSWPAPRRAIQGKVNQLAELILTVAMNGYKFGIAVVKNRNGQHDPNAKAVTWLDCVAARMSLTEPRQHPECA